ncbi:MAG TPA: toprim domain-containing protein, partial [Anaerolineales bacterium]|nr:toprim domain-containing protein [Anaerolineales bacterium]
RSHLFANPEILNYLRQKRGLTDATIETFGLGYAPPGYDNLLKHFSGKYMPQDLVDAGMLSERDSGGLFDRFRHRIMIPIRDENGKMAGFGARIVDPNDNPKFLNSPETAIFTKGRLLYGFDRARKPIRAADQAVIVEGYLDVIALHQAGYENVVSPMGTALTEDQLRLLKRSTRRIVLALDPDVAGQKAVLRGLEAARSAMDKEGELTFDAHGLLRNEARLQADLRVATMPDDLDPDEIVARNKEEWATLIANAKPIITHVMEALSAGQNLNDPKIKNQIAEQVLPLIDDMGTPMERDTYRQALARMLRVDERTLMAAQPKGAVMRRKPRVTEPSRRTESVAVAAVNPRKNIEFYCLSVLIRKPDLVYRLDRKLEEFGLSPLATEDFEYTDHQLLFNVLRQAMGQDEKDHAQYVFSQIPEDLAPLVNELLAQTEKLESSDDKLLEDLLARFLDLRRFHAMSSVTQLKFMQDDEQQQGGENIKVYIEQTMRFTRLLNGLDQAKLKLSKRQA